MWEGGRARGRRGGGGEGERSDGEGSYQNFTGLQAGCSDSIVGYDVPSEYNGPRVEGEFPVVSLLGFGMFRLELI